MNDHTYNYDEQQPFAAAEFAENPEPRCPCVLLLDTSGSMQGDSIEELNHGLQAFREELFNDSLSMKRVEIAVNHIRSGQSFAGFYDRRYVSSAETGSRRRHAARHCCRTRFAAFEETQGSFAAKRNQTFPSVDFSDDRRRTDR